MWYWPIKQSNRQGFLAELLSRKSPAVKASAEKSWSKVVWLIIGIRILNSGVCVYSNEAKMGVEQKNRMYLYKDLRAVILLPSAQSRAGLQHDKHGFFVDSVCFWLHCQALMFFTSMSVSLLVRYLMCAPVSSSYLISLSSHTIMCFCHSKKRLVHC